MEAVKGSICKVTLLWKQLRVLFEITLLWKQLRDLCVVTM